jgi:hypothetical protein
MLADIRPHVMDLANAFKAIEITHEEFIYLRSILEARVKYECPHWFSEVTCECNCGCNQRFDTCACSPKICDYCEENLCRV